MDTVTSVVLTNCVRLTRIDDSFQFYEALVTLDLSHNLVSSILDKSFVSQASKWMPEYFSMRYQL